MSFGRAFHRHHALFAALTRTKNPSESLRRDFLCRFSRFQLESTVLKLALQLLNPEFPLLKRPQNLLKRSFPLLNLAFLLLKRRFLMLNLAFRQLKRRFPRDFSGFNSKNGRFNRRNDRFNKFCSPFNWRNPSFNPWRCGFSVPDKIAGSGESLGGLKYLSAVGRIGFFGRLGRGFRRRNWRGFGLESGNRRGFGAKKSDVFFRNLG